MEQKDLSQVEYGDSHERVTIVKRAPTFKEVLADSKDRTNGVYARVYQKNAWNTGYTDKETFLPEKTTERELINQFGRISDILASGQNIRNKEFDAACAELTDQLYFIGEPELKEAITGIAGKVFEDWKQGKQIIFCIPRGRSETYITIRVLEELKSRYGVEGNNPRRYPQNNPINVLDSEDVTRICSPKRENTIYFLDDFIVSGTHLNTEASRMFDKLIAVGYPPEKVAQMIKIAVVAMPDTNIVREKSRIDYQDSKTGEDKSEYVELYSYFGVPVGPSHGSFGFFTSSFCAPDYSFTEPFRNEIGNRFSLKPYQYPLLTRIVKPWDEMHGKEDMDRKWFNIFRGE